MILKAYNKYYRRNLVLDIPNVILKKQNRIVYLNIKCRSTLTFSNVLTSKISLIHKNNHVCNLAYTPWETIENLWFTLPHCPYMLRSWDNYLHATESW